MCLGDNLGWLAVWGIGLLSLNCWECGFEYRWGHGCSSLVLCRYRPLRRSDHSSRGVLPCVYDYLFFIKKPQDWNGCFAKEKYLGHVILRNILHFLLIVMCTSRIHYKHKIFIVESSYYFKCILLQALRLCTGRTANRGSRGIALLFYDQRH